MTIVRALVDCIKTYFYIDRQDIRCTSVRPYRLPVGENTSDRLRDEITDAEVVLGILTTDTLASSYVAFELGSAWGQRVWTCPLLAGGADQSHIPDPIRDLSPLFLSNVGDCTQLLNDMARTVSVAKSISIINNLTIKGDEAIVNVTHEASRILNDAQGNPHQWDNKVIHQETWIRTTDGWRIKSLEEVKQVYLLRDSKPLNS